MRILIGMSGGLDSTYAAYLLKKDGHQVVGAAVKMHEYTDLSSAMTSCREVGIDYVEIDGREKFEEDVIKPFCQYYLTGRTPNPCIFCNPSVKIGLLVRYAEENGFDRVSTGHYTHLGKENGRYFIQRGSDEKKDQSYMLCRLSQHMLSMMYFPLADLTKDTIKTEGQIFSSSGKKESQEICFINGCTYKEFIEDRYGKMPPGEIISPEGSVCGRHDGLLGYTIGQRKHLGVALGRPVFVSEIDAQNNRVYLSDFGGECSNKAQLSSLVYQLKEEKNDTFEGYVKMRYAAKPVLSRITVDCVNDRADIEFTEQIRAITSGQSGVVYDKDGRILLSGIIR